MDIELKQKKEELETEFLVLALTEEQSRKKQEFEEVNTAIKSKDFSGEFLQTMQLNLYKKIKRIFLVGLGKEKELSHEKLRKASSLVVKKVKLLKIESFDFLLEDLDLKSVAEGLILGNYCFDKYKTKKPEEKEIKKANIITSKNLQKELEEVKKICQGTILARDLTNEPPCIIGPEEFEKLSKEIASKNKLKITVLDQKELEKKGLNMILAVGKGSKKAPRLVILEYNGGGKEKIALVGKGVTFDSGGYNLKPIGCMETMKCDMAGAALVLATIKTASELKLKANIIVAMPMVENMLDSTALVPGDIIKAYNEKTVEVSNTDAEGRLILGDTLSYVEKNFKPDKIIDFATLTEACLAAFGEYVAAALGDKKIIKNLFEAGEKTFERLWEMPLYEEYCEEMKGEITDIKSIGYPKNAGAITGAAFLKNFVEKTPWVHLDIAGTSWYEKERHYIPKNGTGWGVRLMIEYLKK